MSPSVANISLKQCWINQWRGAAGPTGLSVLTNPRCEIMAQCSPQMQLLRWPGWVEMSRYFNVAFFGAQQTRGRGAVDPHLNPRRIKREQDVSNYHLFFLGWEQRGWKPTSHAVTRTQRPFTKTRRTFNWILPNQNRDQRRCRQTIRCCGSYQPPALLISICPDLINTVTY